jgi:adenylyltransferase/sulfurtransferase
MLFDALKMSFRELKLRRNPACPACGDNPTITELIDYEIFCGIEPEGAEAPTGIEEMTATQLKEELDQDRDLFLLDVRNPVEYDICKIDGGHLIPLDELLNRIHELDSAREIVAYCRSGARSAKAVGILQEAGFRKLRNLKGGILAWADDVDPSIPKY